MPDLSKKHHFPGRQYALPSSSYSSSPAQDHTKESSFSFVETFPLTQVLQFHFAIPQQYLLHINESHQYSLFLPAGRVAFQSPPFSYLPSRSAVRQQIPPYQEADAHPNLIMAQKSINTLLKVEDEVPVDLISPTWFKKREVRSRIPVHSSLPSSS